METIKPTHPSKLETLEVACQWHKRIANELKDPIVPEELEGTSKAERLEEINLQKEKHLLYSKVLEALISVRKKQKES